MDSHAIPATSTSGCAPITRADGITFEDAWNRRLVLILDGVAIPVIGLDDLIASKRASGRPKDVMDVENLEAIKLRAT